MPNSIISSLVILLIISISLNSFLSNEENPILLLPSLLATISLIPENVPPQMKSIFVVSTLKKDCSGCFLPPCGGTLQTLPSMILSNDC